MSEQVFTEDYYERGPEKGLSCYVNYQWLPEKTMPAVMTYIDHFGIEPGESILDFGCAKGFYVKALRLLHRDAWGCDVSEYAISHADEQTKPYVKVIESDPVPFDRHFDYIVSKDVLEHMTEVQVKAALESFKKCTPRYLFIIVPLADGGKYVVPEDELDITHVLRFTKQGWSDLFSSCNWKLAWFHNNLPGIKDHQTSKYPNGIGFFTLELNQ
jgi:SAM-dependent methyltransferase